MYSVLLAIEPNIKSKLLTRRVKIPKFLIHCHHDEITWTSLICKKFILSTLLPNMQVTFMLQDIKNQGKNPICA
jgi:hypothetical protein